MKDKKDFQDYFSKKDFSSALDEFLQLDKEQQKSLLSELFQKSEHHRQPDAMSVNVRQLHEGKTFDDFHQAWLPSEKWTDPVEEGGQPYLQFIPEGATRIINAVSTHNPREVMTVGFHWLNTKEQYEWMLEMVKNIANEPSNQERQARIKRVAEKKSGGFYQIKSDENLGRPF